MNRRHTLSSVRRSIARKQEPGINAVAWFSGQSFHQSAADHSTVERMSIADLDRIGPRLVTTAPVERAVCIYCTEAPATDTNFPYCSSQCAINAENS